MYTMNEVHFETQAIVLKKLYYQYKAQRLIIDANGIGMGLMDYMVKSQIDTENNITYPPFGVINDVDGVYKQFKTPDCEFDAIYAMKANATINTAAHANLQSQISSGRVKFLIDERIAKNRLMGTKRGQAMTPEERADFLKPFTLTSILKEELLNLRQENDGVNIILRQANKRIKKDKVSSLEYALYYIREEEDNKIKKKKRNVTDFLFMN